MVPDVDHGEGRCVVLAEQRDEAVRKNDTRVGERANIGGQSRLGRSTIRLRDRQPARQPGPRGWGGGGGDRGGGRGGWEGGGGGGGRGNQEGNARREAECLN